MPNENSWRVSISRHADDEPASINFSPPVRYLQDETYCQTLHKDFEALGEAWERRKATPDLWSQLPETSGLYMFIWVRNNILGNVENIRTFSFNWCLYVGQTGAGSTNTLRARYKQEYAKYISNANPENFWPNIFLKDRKKLLQRLLSLYPIDYWYVSISDQNKIANLESRLIKLLNPPGNQRGLAVRPQAPQQAFRTY